MAQTGNRHGRGPMGHGPGVPVEKAKDFKGTIGKILSYMGSYKPALIVVMIFAVASTVFNVIVYTGLDHDGNFAENDVSHASGDLGEDQPHADEIFRVTHGRRGALTHYQ